MAKKVGTIRERLLERRVIDETTGCWLWTGANYSGYGLLKSNGETLRTHRLAYELFVGPIPERMVCRHTCGCKNCFNPEHLLLASQKDVLEGNSERGSPSFQPITHCVRGHLYDEPNTFINKKGDRVCRACKRKNELARWHLRKAGA